MALLFYSQDDDAGAWRQELSRRLPELDFRLWPDIGDPADITMALVWLPPPGLLAGLPNLKAIFSLGAGIDAMLRDPTLPDLPLCRMVDPSLTSSMSEFVLALVLRYHRNLDVYERQQRERRWQLELPRPADATRVGVMGLGVLGADAARLLVRNDFDVRGWSRTAKRIEGVTSHAGAERLDTFLGGLDILVNLLPLTPETEGVLNARLFAKLPRGARLINVARGRHLVEPDLLAALEEGRLAHATLDVFATEPLPEEHPFWGHPQVTVLPHTASYSLPRSGAETVVENIRRLREGRPLEHVVDRARGY
ncbi:2-hydroxyacid dehydrogenase [Marinimicrococcus flavescens]|uniref:Glyoxylate/hydroxypyruvate reductase A n=1 Tax=Marinimicrococcus flavescens TaxID=3031815 RepID=A0AAP4D7N4_9PROT|nr:glyoxylate/hydroxypyruvate reductase A [Marinimicrococcus flavescens]